LPSFLCIVSKRPKGAAHLSKTNKKHSNQTKNLANKALTVKILQASSVFIVFQD
jgi:hypothetical protein